MTEEEFREYLALGRESRGVEFKGPGSRTDKHFFARVVRAVIGMANRRDGGVVILGVEEHAGVLNPVGLSREQLGTWNRYDHVAQALGNYTDPSVGFGVEVVHFEGDQFIVLRVAEFEEWPVLCAGEFQGQGQGRSQDVLRRGALYLRGRRSIETAEIPSLEELRELLELATEKQLRRFLSTAQRVGLRVEPQPLDDDLFREQTGDLE